MRTLLTIALVLMMATMAMAQDTPIDQGAVILGGTVSFQTAGGDFYENADGDGETTLTFAPEFGYFVSNQIMVGALINYNKWSQGDNEKTILNLGPMVGYYFLMGDNAEVKGSMYPYIKAFLLLESYEEENWADPVKTTSFGAKLGMDYMLSDAVALDVGIQYKAQSWSQGDSDSVDGAVIDFGVGIAAFLY